MHFAALSFDRLPHFLRVAESENDLMLKPVVLWGKGQIDFIDSFQMALAPGRSIRLSLNNEKVEKVDAFLRSSCDDKEPGTMIGSLLKDERSVTVDVTEVTQTVDTRRTTPSYPADFPIKGLRGSTEGYSSVFCKQICIGLER